MVNQTIETSDWKFGSEGFWTKIAKVNDDLIVVTIIELDRVKDKYRIDVAVNKHELPDVEHSPTLELAKLIGACLLVQAYNELSTQKFMVW